jgi:hypothetical protein
MRVILHQTIRVNPTGIALPGLPERIEKLPKIPLALEDDSAIVPPVERVVDQTIADSPERSSHAPRLVMEQ